MNYVTKCCWTSQMFHIYSVYLCFFVIIFMILIFSLRVKYYLWSCYIFFMCYFLGSHSWTSGFNYCLFIMKFGWTSIMHILFYCFVIYCWTSETLLLTLDPSPWWDQPDRSNWTAWRLPVTISNFGRLILVSPIETPATGRASSDPLIDAKV